MRKSLIFLTLFLLALPAGLFAQISHGGSPPSFDKGYIPEPEVINLRAPDLATLLREDAQSGKNGTPERVGVTVKAGLDLADEERKYRLRNGDLVYLTSVEVEGALALSGYFSRFHLPVGGELYVYDGSKEHLLGAFSSENNKEHRLFSTELVPGEIITFEYYEPFDTRGQAELMLDEIAFHYKNFRNISTSDYCEVNVNCSPEGDNWQDQKRGVARIYVKEGSSLFWCTGTLINNTRRDWAPYFLTAEHCGDDASADDYLQWVFYFNFEAPGCEDPQVNPTPQTMEGATFLSGYEVSAGSDFKLLLLQDEVPATYEPFYNGWDRRNQTSPSGVTIHHPSGDIKKISTYISPLGSTSWSGSEETHWEVVWSGTENGHGVTEGGSSGSPIFDSEGYVIGTLSGGRAACDPGGSGPNTGPDKPDFYGKFSWSWESNGNTPETRLRDWLDPENTGELYVRGINSQLTADFNVDKKVILAGESIQFTNVSAGTPDSYEWTFDGGSPSSSTSKDPGSVMYEKAGIYDVSLVVNKGDLSDTTVRKRFIEVVGEVYPNPARDVLNVYIGEEPVNFVRVELVDLYGRKVYDEELRNDAIGFQLIRIDLAGMSSGIYFVRLTRNNRFSMQKVMVVN